MTSEHVRPLYWWSASQLSELSRLFSVIWSKWLTKWGIQDVNLSMPDCQLAHEIKFSADDWLPLPGVAIKGWYCKSGVGSGCLLGSVFDVVPAQVKCYSTDETISSRLAEKIWQNWLDEIATLIDFLPSETSDLSIIPVHHSSPWSGAVQISMTWCDTVFKIHLAPEIVIGLLKNKTDTENFDMPALTPLNDVLGVFATSLNIELASIELELGVLQSMSLGDVITLPKYLDEPLLAKTSNGETLCLAYLGQINGKCAAELLPNHA